MNFALGLAHERNGDFAAAFQAIEIANRQIAPKSFANRLGRNQRPPQVAVKDFFDPSDVLAVKGIIETELFDQFGNVLCLLGSGHKGCRSAFRTEGHQDGEYQNGNPEKNKNQ